jgi:plastocyanin
MSKLTLSRRPRNASARVMPRYLGLLGAVGVVAGMASTGGVAMAAQSAPAASHAKCTNDKFVNAYDGKYFFYAKQSVSGGAGITLTLTESAGHTVGTTYTVTSGTSAGLSLDIISGSAKKDISNAIQKQVTNTITLTGTYKVKKHAVLSYGAFGYEYKWQKGFISSACKVVVTAAGTAKSPAKAPGFDVTSGS